MGIAGRSAAAIVAAVVCAIVIAPAPGYAASATATARVTAGSALNVRTGPAMDYLVVRTVGNGTGLTIVCQLSGQSVAGSVRTTAVWDQLADGRFISDAYVAWSGAPTVGACVTGTGIGALNVRTNASTLSNVVGTVSNRGALAFTCQLGGEWVAGPSRKSPLWDRLPNGRFVADAQVSWSAGRPALPWCSLSAGPPPGRGEPFLRWVGAYAHQMKATYGVPAAVTAAQAILESGWGTSDLTRDGNNFFGMKCFNSPGRIATGCRPYNTRECVVESCYDTSASFRVYDTVLASFADHSASLASLSRYRTAFRHAGSPDRFAVEIHRAGYATSPTYARTLINLMRQYNLYRFE
jgi:hypothetical protein